MHLNNKGFTLAEIIIASLVAAIAFVAILGTLSNITVLNELNQERTMAAMHAQYILENIRNADFTGLETDINNGVWDFTTAQLAANPFNFTTLAGEAVTTTNINSGNPLQVRVAVSWNDRRNQARLYSLETMRTD
jgi:type II secretory pathway pseudopilin PulG